MTAGCTSKRKEAPAAVFAGSAPVQTRSRPSKAVFAGSAPVTKDASSNRPLGTALMDGRTKRIKESLVAAAASTQEALDKVTFTEDLRTGGDKARKTALQDAY